ncbi:MAG TPA: MOSC domain-containing protein [Polyangiales bacterium]|nr:MOSC domain-containing protein [Polyangiales bacterium]
MQEGELRSLLSQRRAPGRVIWLGARAERGAPVRELPSATLIASQGMDGDYTARGRGGGKRQLTLIQAEHLDVIAKLVGRERVRPDELRRNLVIEGINLHALRLRTFRVGNALLEGTGYCEPCSKMERALGVGGYNAVRGHGGILARVLEGAPIQLGDEVDFAEV